MKFLRYIGRDSWTGGINNIRKSLLNTSVMDQSIMEKRGNDNYVFENIRFALCRLNPEIVKKNDE